MPVLTSLRSTDHRPGIRSAASHVESLDLTSSVVSRPGHNHAPSIRLFPGFSALSGYFVNEWDNSHVYSLVDGFLALPCWGALALARACTSVDCTVLAVLADRYCGGGNCISGLGWELLIGLKPLQRDYRLAWSLFTRVLFIYSPDSLQRLVHRFARFNFVPELCLANAAMRSDGRLPQIEIVESQVGHQCVQ